MAAPYDDNCTLIPANVLEQSEDFEEWLNKSGVQFIITNDCLEFSMIDHGTDPFLNGLGVRESSMSLCQISDIERDNISDSNTNITVERLESKKARPLILRSIKSNIDKNMNSVNDGSLCFPKTDPSKCEILESKLNDGLNLIICEDNNKWQVNIQNLNGEDIFPCHCVLPSETGGQTCHIPKMQTIICVNQISITSSPEVNLPRLQTHIGLRLLFCPLQECRCAFVRVATAKLHTLVHLGLKPFKCDFPNCTWAFYTPFKLRRHRETHTKRKDFICPLPECSRRFTTIYNLNCHRRLHDRPANLPCTVKGCNQQFQTIRARELHLKSHGQSEAPYHCAINSCNRPFFSLTSLSLHTRAHTHKDTELRCQWPDCGRVFELPCRLKEHSRKHTGQRPYCCSYEDCKWTFPTASKLRRHQSTHTNDRKFHCTIGTCNKSFLRSEHLRDHTLTHIGQRTFQCEVCAASFLGKSSLYLHIKKLHPEQNQACARALPYLQNSEKPSADALLEQAIQSLGVPSDMMLGSGLLPDEPLELLEHENFSTVNLRDLD